MNLYIYYAGQSAGEQVTDVTQFWTSEGFINYIHDNNRHVQPVNSGDKVIRKVVISGW